MKTNFNLSSIVCAYCLASLLSTSTFAQIDLQCAGRDMHSIYLVDFASFYRMDSVDTNPTIPLLLGTFPTGSSGGGISINSNLDSAAGPVTMYFIAAGTPYYFWNGNGWTNTSHSSSSLGAINIGGTSRYIFNFDDNEQDIYRYDGTGNDALLVSNVVSNGGVIHDVATDREGNFYLFFTNDELIRAYNPSGIPIDSFTTSGFPAGPNCGFTILGDRLYGVTCNGVEGLYEGIRSGSTFNFSLVQTITPGSGYFIDIASCPNAANVIAVFENPDQPHFIIYPNPARDITTIKFDNTSMLEIRDNLGVLMETISVQGMTECRINTSNWNTGVYFINALSTKKISTRSKLVIQ